jgi:hypothetical protein
MLLGLVAPVTAKAQGTYTYLGCYADSTPRALPAMLMDSGATAANCVAAAAAQGYSYAGLQWYGYCFAGNTLQYGQLPESSCNTPCGADSSQTCGGGWANSVYLVSWARSADLAIEQLAASPSVVGPGDTITVAHLVASSATSTASGPFAVEYYLSPTVVIADPTLPAATQVLTAGVGAGQSIPVTTSVSVPAGTAAGTYRIIAIVDRAGAAGDPDPANNTAVSDPIRVGSVSCSSPPEPIDDGNPCTVDACDPVDGVTHRPVPEGTSCQGVIAPSYVGCYTDSSTWARALPNVLASGGATPSSCIAAAAAAGYAYAGLQAGGWCFAGNDLRYDEVSDAQCNWPCSSSPGETCGGSWRNSVYGVGGLVPFAQCVSARVCSAAAVCLSVAASPGTPCDDGDLCTYGDICSAQGTCVGLPASCSAATGPCEQVICDGTATCRLQKKPSGASCSGGGACGGEVCDGVSPKCQPRE